MITIWMNEEWTPNSSIKFGSDIKMKSIHKEEVFDMFVGTLIT